MVPPRHFDFIISTKSLKNKKKLYSSDMVDFADYKFKIHKSNFDYTAIIQSLQAPFLMIKIYRFSTTLIDNYLGI